MAQTIQECLDYLAAARESVEELSLAAWINRAGRSRRFYGAGGNAAAH